MGLTIEDLERLAENRNIALVINVNADIFVNGDDNDNDDDDNEGEENPCVDDQKETGDVLVARSNGANAHHVVGENSDGLPILAPWGEPGERWKFPVGHQFQVYKDKIRPYMVDGDKSYWEIPCALKEAQGFRTTKRFFVRGEDVEKLF